MSYEARSREIADAVIAIEGVDFRPEKPITFKSGIKSPIYCDKRRLPFWPEQWAKVIRGLEALIAEREIPIDVVGGVEAAGIPHSAALGFSMRKPSVFIRKELKEHGTKKRVEGAVVSDCLAIISYHFPETVERFKRAGVRLHATTTFQEVLKSAQEHKMIDEAGAAVVRDWLQEPRSWAQRHGFE